MIFLKLDTVTSEKITAFEERLRISYMCIQQETNIQFAVTCHYRLLSPPLPPQQLIDGSLRVSDVTRLSEFMNGQRSRAAARDCLHEVGAKFQLCAPCRFSGERRREALSHLGGTHSPHNSPLQNFPKERIPLQGFCQGTTV